VLCIVLHSTGTVAGTEDVITGTEKYILFCISFVRHNFVGESYISGIHYFYLGKVANVSPPLQIILNLIV
jgi:hypothetical protein